MLHFFINGVIIGFLASMPVGAVAILTVQRTMNNGLWSGFSVGMGAGLGDLVYAGVAALGLTFISDFLISIKFWLALFGGIFLLIMGYKIYSSDTVKQIRQKRFANKNMANYFISSFFLAITNPITIIGFTGFFASFGVITNNTSFTKILILLLGIVIGSSAWWFGIAATVNKFKNRISLRNLVTINRIAGILLVLFGVGLLVSMFVFNKDFK